MTTGFQTTNGQIIGPNGQPFMAHGVDVLEGNEPSAASLQANFPGVNFVRLAIYDYANPDQLASYVNSLTSAGLVVEIGDYYNGTPSNNGGSQGTIFSGSQLGSELAWYSAIGSAFKNNPYVWFSTNNEPSEVNPATGAFDPAALSAWQKQTYDAIRNTGNQNPILLEANGWSNNGQPVMLQGYDAADYAGMTNVAWDMHYYGWLTGYSTDQGTNNSFLAAMAQQTQQITSANGKMPVIIGEFGDSTTGLSIDANSVQVVAAVLQSGLGYSAWAWGVGFPGDGLLDGSGGLSAYGRQVAAAIKAAAAQSPATNPVDTTKPPSASGTVLLAGSSGSIIDAAHNKWTIVNGAVQENGAPAGYTSNVIELATVNGAIWQENANHLWWQWSGTTWGTGAGTATSPLPAAPTPSANNTVIKAGGTIVDASGNKWTITPAGVVDENATAAGYTSGVAQLAYVNGVVWQENTAGLWWKWSGTDWGTGNGTATSPVTGTSTTPPTPTDTISVSAAGKTTVITTGTGTVSGDTFSAASTGVIQATLGATPAFIQFIGNAGVMLIGGAGSAIVSATGGTNSFTMGSGLMDITGGTGANAYVVHAGAGFLAIEDFAASKGDALTVDTSLKASMKTGSDGMGGTMISFGGNAAIDLRHASAAPAIHFS